MGLNYYLLGGKLCYPEGRRRLQTERVQKALYVCDEDRIGCKGLKGEGGKREGV